MALARQQVAVKHPTHGAEPTCACVVVHKNRTRAFWSLVIIFFMIPISAWLLFLGLRAGRLGVGWSLVLFGGLGLVAFTASAVLVIRTLRAPWHLALYPSHLAVHAPAYELEVPWEQIAGIAVDEVARRLGCVLVFEDPAAVANGATYLPMHGRSDAVRDAASMRARMEHNYENWGYHYGFPGRILEVGPEGLAELLASARTGALWQQGEEAEP